MNMEHNPQPAWRRHLVVGVFGLLAAVLVWRAFDLQLTDREFLQDHGDQRYLRVVQTEAHRGMITDRHDEPLAISTPVSSVWVNPSQLVQNRGRWPELAKLVDMSEDQLNTLILPRRKRGFLYLKRHVQPAVAEAVAKAAIPGVHLAGEYRRFYPGVEIAAHLLGFTNVDDRGQEGIELAFDAVLTGTPGKDRVIKDRLGRVIEYVERIQPAAPGKDLALSIDRRLQYVANRELGKAVQKHKAMAGLMVILDVNTGEILALVNQPSFNPNNRAELKGEFFRNRAVTDLFEPGSTIKPFTIAAGLESGQYTPATRIETAPGFFRVGRHTIKDIHSYGNLDVTGVIEKSSNVGSTKIALSMDADILWNVFNNVGFGHLTQVELPGETNGRLVNHKHWREIEHATLAYGYGMSVNALQLVRAYATVANGGMLYPVTILRREQAPQGMRVMSQTTADAVSLMMERVVQTGTAKTAQVYGYRVGGKTGTVHKNIQGGGYAEKDYRSLFAGYLPVSKPRLAAVVVIDGPRAGQHYGGLVAAPVFAEVMHEAARILNLPADALDGVPADSGVRMASSPAKPAPAGPRIQ
ncbi:MAG: penicillin-binding protein 2 [Gammaproteobacteria bacterium]|nr:penicillin-binding protein 2 [Gammaproteobacteria bacterium]